MSSLSITLLLVLGAAILPVSATAQARTPHYRAQPDTLYYEDTNPHHVYWVRGPDSIGGRRYARSVDRQVWEGQPESLTVRMQSHQLDISRGVTLEIFELNAVGRVQRIDGRPPLVNTQVDLVPSIPAAPLRVGLTWVDTLAAEGGGPAHNRLYHVVRSYRVQRIADSAGRRLAYVTDSGTARYRDGFVIDSSGSVVWLDVSGPVRERFTFDMTNGRLVSRSWQMNLVGIGGIPVVGASEDTVPAGLISAMETTLISQARARALLRPLPGADTSFTLNEEPVLLHTVQRGPDSVLSGFARNDGMVGTVTTTYFAQRPVHYQALWTDSTGQESRIELFAEGQRLRLRRASGTDSVLDIPAGRWGITDYAMQEHLVPVLLAVPADGETHPFAIYRPMAAHWDSGTVAARRHSGYSILTIHLGEHEPEYLLITQNGDLLFIENSGPRTARRVPLPGARADLMAKILKGLQQ